MRNMWTFETKQFRIVAAIEPDDDVDTSFDETGETDDKLASGEWEAFQTIVTVTHKATGAVLGSDSLCGSIYADADEFFSDHRDRDPMNRNCSIMRAARGNNVSIGHYFPDMVRQAIADARNNMVSVLATRLRAA